MRAGEGMRAVQLAEGLMRTYSTGLIAEVESTAISSIAGAIIDGMRFNAPASWHECLPCLRA